jgi:hypothetical protein
MPLIDKKIDSRILESFICSVKKSLPLTLKLKVTVITFQAGFQGGLWLVSSMELGLILDTLVPFIVIREITMICTGPRGFISIKKKLFEQVILDTQSFILLFERSSYLTPQVVGQNIRWPSALHDPVNSYMNGLICACYKLNV